MPQPVKLSLSPSADDLNHRPKLTIAIARIGVHWAEVEQELASLFAMAMLLTVT
jgi:hypothetical protein